MAPISPGKMSGPPRRSKKPTATAKAHRFEGFGRRIGKIKIDPVHTVQETRVAEDHGDLATSYFRSSLDEWAELNLSATFTSFLNKAQPLSESLPQLLYHADQIFSLLHEHVAKQDVLALEPLLSLVAHLAHDLGSAFKKHFASTVRLVAQVSASVEDPAAIENCFTCLAWMFKYLSRLLVQDLRPLLDIMVPYFSSKKEYIRRFSAESLAFLLRKAAVMYQKKAKPLETSISYLFQQLQEKQNSELESFEMALMTLLSESAIGTDAHLHSSAADLFRCLFDTVGRMNIDSQRPLAVLDGTVVSLVHQTDANGFHPLLQLITEVSKEVHGGVTNHDKMSIRLLLDVTATRKGSRISQWNDMIEALLVHFPHANDVTPLNHSITTEVITLCAITFQYCPMDQLLPLVNRVLDTVTSAFSVTQFFTFCDLVARLGKQRFQDLILPRLQQYIVSSWRGNEDGLCVLLQQLRKTYTISPKPKEAGYVTCPTAWEQHILNTLVALPSSIGLPEYCSKYFQLNDYMHFPKESVHHESLRNLLEPFINSALDQQNVMFEMPLRLAVGWALKLYTSMSKPLPQPSLDSLITRLLRCRPEYYQLTPFLAACLEILNQTKPHGSSTYDYCALETALCDNMLSESSELRQISLEILLALGKAQSNDWLVETCNLLLELINIPYSPSNARQIAMLIRRLPKQQELSDQSTTSNRLIPLFGLGLLRQYHDQTRKDVCVALGSMALTNKVDGLILEVATQWLQKPGVLKFTDQVHTKDEKPSRLSPFECSNYQYVQKCSHEAFQRNHDPEEKLKQEFEQAHTLRSATTPTESRVLALHLFLEMPDIAERRSRALSPVFLSVQQNMNNHHVPQSDESASSHTISPDFHDQPWSLRERKLFLELIGKFVNPKVLYRSREIYDHLLELLTNGNAEIRKLAFLAIMNWKEPSVLRYKEPLLRVAEEKNATTELALLLANDNETGFIELQDRPSVLQVLLRLIFGQLVARSGTHGSQEAKRKSILRLLFRMEEHEVNLFLGIALGRLNEISFLEQATLPGNVLDHDLLPQDQQYGFLRMMLSIQEILQNQFAPYGKKIVDAVLYCTARACQQTDRTSMNEAETNPATALVRNIRRSGIQCLTTIFEHSEDIDWNHYLPMIFDGMVSPRVPNLAIELAQGISGLLRLFSVWSKCSRLVYLLAYNPQLSGNLWTILSIPSARDDVKSFVLDHILIPLLEMATIESPSQKTARTIVEFDIDVLLNSFVGLLQRQPAKDLLLSATKAIQPLAPFAVSSTSANEVLNLLITLICEPAQRIAPHVKGQLLSATGSLLESRHNSITLATKERLYDVAAGLFNYFKDQPNRIILTELLAALAGDNQELQDTVKICQDLNAVSTRHLGELDYERQVSAYNAINSLSVLETSPRRWPPILQNLIFFARTADDFAIRSNAVGCLKRFIIDACNTPKSQTMTYITSILLPALKKGARDDSELVRADFVVMYGLVVKNLPDAPNLEDMKVLLVGDDEEASFFTNILHIQQHRRLRAIRRLVTEVERGVIQPTNIADFFLPLLDKFITDEGEDELSHGTKGQSIAAITVLLQWIDWKSFRTIFRQYRSDLDTVSRPEKDAIKLLSNGADALTSVLTSNMDVEVDTRVQPYLRSSLPPIESVGNELKSNFIPKLSKFIHHKDEAEISLRIPAARVAVKLIKLLPAEEIPLLVAPIILDISQILRSRTQESRDIARNTLAEIVLLLGSSSIQFVLREMRTTLTRGYQLHVLSYALHTILLQSAPSRAPGDLDYCLDEVVSVIMDDIFGIVGQEKENQDYISSMKEVRSSKSQDSMELLAKSTSVNYMRKLVQPFQALLKGNLSTKQLRQVDELFRRIGVGISHNPAASSRDLLVFAYELIKAFYQQRIAIAERVMTNDEKTRQRFLVQLKSASETTKSTSASLQYKIARFALDLVRSTLAKNPVLLTPENVHGFLPVIGDSLIEAQEDVRISALRLLSTIIRLPLPELDKNAPLYVTEAVKVIKGSISTNEESAQAAMKLVAAILRERRDVEVRESDVAYLLHRTMPDVEEPDRQGVTFNFIKAVLARKYELPEVYELIDKIAAMMVINQTRSARDAARGVFVHFLLEYPQSKNRWTKQLRFLVKNLEYEFREGRQSVMEAIHLLLQKMRGELLNEFVSTFFIPVVLRMANDDDSGCREMAGALLAQTFRAADPSQLITLLEPLKSWLEQSDNAPLVKVSLQAWSVYFDVFSTGAEVEVTAVRKSIARALKDEETGESDWELQYQALELLSKISTAYPKLVMTQSQASIWGAIRRLLSSRHQWIQISTAGLVGTFFQDCASTGKPLKLPLESPNGLRFDEAAIRDVLRDSIRAMKRNEGNLDLAQKTLQNLAYVGKFIEATKMTYEVKAKPTTNSVATQAGTIEEFESDSEGEPESGDAATVSISASKYLLDQLTLILRREPGRLTTASFTPRVSALSLLSNLVSDLSISTLSDPILTSILTPLMHITDPSLQPPRSVDPTFAVTYQTYTESAQTLQETIQHKVGDAKYVKLMTEVSKIVRERRGDRRTKRAIERVAEPEKAEKEKKRRKDMKARRKKDVVDIHRKKRRSDLGF